MNDTVHIAVEMNQWAWSRFKDAVDGLGDDEIDWRPLPQGNNINIIVRHLRIEAQWHLDGITRGLPMPGNLSEIHQNEIDAVPVDFHANLAKLNELYEGFLEVLHTLTSREVEQRTGDVYGAVAQQTGRPHLLGYHQAMHVAMHCAQIRTIRNLYRASRDQPRRFSPDNPTFPRGSPTGSLGASASSREPYNDR